MQDQGDQNTFSGAQPVGQQGGTTPPPPPVIGDDQGQQPVTEESYLRPRPPDTELGIGAVGDFATSVGIPPHPNTTFDEAYFLKMLSGSISLTKNEKKKIVEAIPKLSQYQIDELIKIFEEERRKFAELDEKHQVKIRELQQKQVEDWRDLEMEKQQVQQKGADDEAAAALRAKLLGTKPKARKCQACDAEVTDAQAMSCPKCGGVLA